MFNMKKLVVLLLCAGLVFQAHFGIAGPQGGKVVGGNANISQSGPNTTINQTSDRAIINWNSFDIGKNESVRHNMPSSNSAGLHRVVGKGGPSNIEGLLQSNGNVYLVNPAGVVIHNGAKIDVNGFVATTRDIANDNFMKGKMVFDKPGMPGAAIINQGNITLKDNGLAALVAPTVRNDGIIAGKLGKVALGGSEAAWKLDMTGDDLIAFTMDENAVNTLHAADGTPLASVQNNGKIKAEGGVVVLTASQLDGIVGSVVNNGEISAASAETKGGKIIFLGQGNKVDVVNNGQLDVSSKAAEGGTVRMTGQGAVTHAGKIDATGKAKGGNVVITGENVTLKSGSRIDASGTNGGGTVLVGGNARGKGPEQNAKTTLVQSDAEILADAKLNGDGGQIVVWADEKTQFDGKAMARGGENGGDGGLVETSAKLLIIGDPAVVNTSAKKGKTGTWLLDPEDWVIDPVDGDFSGEELSSNLELNNISLITSDSAYPGNGDIIINDKIEWSSNTILTLNAYGEIIIGAPIISKGNEAGLIMSSTKGGYKLDSGKINIFGDNATLKIDDHKYIFIRNMQELSEIQLDSENIYYALVNNIDSSAEFENFTPIGRYSKPVFEGTLDGLGNTIYNLYSSEGGLFSYIGQYSLIKNLNIYNANISAEHDIGILANRSWGEVNNVNVNGTITAIGGGYVGGLIGDSDSLISNSSANVSIIAEDSWGVGGLVGFNYFHIKQSRANAKIKYINRWDPDELEFGDYVNVGIGSFIGVNDWDVENCFSNGNIDAEGYNILVGGFVGYGKGHTIRNSYTSTAIKSEHAGGFAGELYSIYKNFNAPAYCFNCYYDKSKCDLDKGAYSVITDTTTNPDGIIIPGLTSEEMREKASFKGWDFENIWKINEGKGYPELRYVANNDLIIPDKPVDPNPPIIDPDPDPDPKPDPHPDDPDNPNPKPDTPETPDNPDVPVNPDLKPDTPVNPDKPDNPNPKPDTPVTPERPSNPGTIPSTPPSQPSLPETKPNTPATPSRPSNLGNNSGDNTNIGQITIPAGTTITYKKIDGNVHVFQDNQHIGILDGNRIKVDNSDIPVEIEDGKNYVTGGDLQVKDYDPYTATPEERQAYLEKVQRELEEQKARHDQALTEIFNDSQRKNIANIIEKTEKSISNEMNLLSDVIVDLYACELAIMGSIFSGEKISGAAGGLSNFGAAVHNNLKTIWGTLTGNGWGDQLRSKTYMQALTTKDFMALYMLTIADNAQKRFNQTDNMADKLQLLCQMELATKLADSIANDYRDTLIYFAKESGEEAAEGLLDELVGKVLNKDNLKKYFEGKVESVTDIAARTTNTPDLIREVAKRDDAIDASAALTTQLSKGAINKTGYKDYFSPEQFKTDDSIQGMVNRLMHSDEVNTIINNTMEKYNGLVKNAGLEGSFQNGKMSFNQDIRDCWNWDPGIAESLNNVMTSDLPGAKLGDAIGNVLPALGSLFGYKPKQEQLNNLYTKSDSAQPFSSGGAGGGGTNAGGR